METFGIVCGACGATTSVAAGRAGGKVPCRACGADCTVPRLGELRRLSGAPASGSPAAGRDGIRRSSPGTARWSVAHGCVLAGAVAGLLGAGAASWLGDGAGTRGVDEAGIRALVQVTDLRSVLLAWRDLAQNGLKRPAADQERRQRAAASVARLWWLCAGAGGVLAIGGALMLVIERRGPRVAASPAEERSAPGS